MKRIERNYSIVRSNDIKYWAKQTSCSLRERQHERLWIILSAIYWFCLSFSNEEMLTIKQKLFHKASRRGTLMWGDHIVSNRMKTLLRLIILTFESQPLYMNKRLLTCLTWIASLTVFSLIDNFFVKYISGLNIKQCLPK